MKNIHILKTDQPSRLHYYFELNKKYALSKEPLNWRTASYVYITSSEEIKEGDWVLNISNNKIFKQDSFKPDAYTLSFYKKIILTTDPTLIADGVQAIDDEFLEWFVKNPTCEFVEVELECFYQGKCVKERCLTYCCDEKQYKIIIPQEEPKQSTLEEAAEKLAPNSSWRLGFIAGGNYMVERMYSEEDLRKSFHVGRLYQGRESDTTFEGWFEQFKKK